MSHIPVLKDEVIEQFNYLSNIKDGYFVDGTIGLGRHSLAIAKNLSRFLRDPARGGGNLQLKFIGIDKDEKALDIAKKNIKAAGLGDRFILIHDDFKNIDEILQSHSLLHNNKTINGALIDLGVSSMQLDDKERGFSFQDLSARLDMRMDQNQIIDAEEILKSYPESELAKIIFDYGEERFAKNIAKNICKARKEKEIKSVGDLISILEQSIPVKVRMTSKKHFATRTFQALRIEVNKELIGLDEAINDFVNLLAPKAKLAVITFHSLEDRIVKNVFKDLENPCTCPPLTPICNCNKKAKIKILTKKPVVASQDEIRSNPRSRSAKLRVVEKINC